VLCVDAHSPTRVPSRLYDLPLLFLFVVHHVSLDNRNSVPYIPNAMGTVFRLASM
jgi:hypothetical protein